MRALIAGLVVLSVGCTGFVGPTGTGGGGDENDGGTGGGSAGGGTGGATGGGTATGGGAAGGTAGGAGGSAGGSAGGAAGGTTLDGGCCGPDGGVSILMSFFVTSDGLGTGGDLTNGQANGLAGADKFCKDSATAVSPLLGAKTWHAYLSVTGTNARTRIGNGPWLNAKGVTIANNVEHLHDDAGMNALTYDTALDELGNPVPVTLHDVLTGTNADGTLATGSTCVDWTSTSATQMARVGHSNRDGGGFTSWNSAHDTPGCSDNGGQSIRQGGGRGSLYCFEVN